MYKLSVFNSLIVHFDYIRSLLRHSGEARDSGCVRSMQISDAYRDEEQGRLQDDEPQTFFGTELAETDPLGISDGCRTAAQTAARLLK